MKEIPNYIAFATIVLLVFCIALFTFGYVNLNGKINQQTQTGGPAIPHQLASIGGYDMPETGNVRGEVFIVDSKQSFSKSEWRIIIDNWTVFEQYTVPVLTVDRTAANHEKVKWNVLDASLIVIDEGELGLGNEYIGARAVLIYTLDDEEYIAWTTACYHSPCYGGARKWHFGGL